MAAGSPPLSPPSSRRIPSANSCSTSPGRGPTRASAAAITPSSPSARRSHPRPDPACWCAPTSIARRSPRSCSRASRNMPRATGSPALMPCFSTSRRAPRARGAAGCCGATASFIGATAATRASMTTSPPSRRRSKKARRERRRVAEAGVRFETRFGGELDEGLLERIYALHRDTFVRHGHEPYLTRAFFSEAARVMPESLMVKLAVHGRAVVAAAIFFWCEEALFGRYWGADADYHSLHFEACYHQGIEFCIERRIGRFEPGTQGEHKVSRGFEPALTWSAHYIVDREFRAAIADYLTREAGAVEAYAHEVQAHVPYRGRRSAGVV